MHPKGHTATARQRSNAWDNTGNDAETDVETMSTCIHVHVIDHGILLVEGVVHNRDADCKCMSN